MRSKVKGFDGSNHVQAKKKGKKAASKESYI
jgi:hypothetical protein